ncbi:MAG: lipopolysaccharide biosynthesis protein, partial [Gemmatimonadota bacterium]
LAVVGGAILARLLLPGDFGVFAMALTLVGFVMWFRDFGLPMAATQRETLDHGAASALFKASIWLSLATTVFVIAMGPAVAAFYGEARLVGVIAVLSIATFVSGFSIIPEGLMIRRMRFAPLAAIEIGAGVASFATGLTVAFLGGGYWALVAQHLALVIVRSLAVCAVCGWRPGSVVDAPSAESARSMLRYGRQLTFARVLQYFGQNTDRILVGFVYGRNVLGLYDNSFRWSRYPVRQVFGPLRNVIVSALSRLQGDAERYRTAFVRAGLPVYSASIPALAYMVVDAPHLIMAVLGDQWLEAIPLFRFLAASGIATTVRASTAWSYLSEGRTSRQLRWEMISAPLLIGAIVVGLQWGVLGVAVAFALGSWALVVPGAWFCSVGSRLRLGDFFAAWWRPFAASVAAGIFLFVLSPETARTLPPGIGELGAFRAVVFRGVTYVAAYALIWVALPGGLAKVGELRAIARQLRRA